MGIIRDILDDGFFILQFKACDLDSICLLLTIIIFIKILDPDIICPGAGTCPLDQGTAIFLEIIVSANVGFGRISIKINDGIHKMIGISLVLWTGKYLVSHILFGREPVPVNITGKRKVIDQRHPVWINASGPLIDIILFPKDILCMGHIKLHENQQQNGQDDHGHA